MRFYTGEVLEEHKRNIGGVLMFSRRTERQKYHVVSEMLSAAVIMIGFLNVITASIRLSRVAGTGLSRMVQRHSHGQHRHRNIKQAKATLSPTPDRIRMRDALRCDVQQRVSSLLPVAAAEIVEGRVAGLVEEDADATAAIDV